MRHPIEKSPRDGTAIILEDDASGTYDVAHWSTEAGEWLGENGEPIKIAPTHWYPIPRDQYLSREDEGARDQPRSGRSRRLASIAVTLVAAALIVTYFRAEVAGYVTRYSGQQDFLGVPGLPRSQCNRRVYHRAVGEPGFAYKHRGCRTAGRSRSGQRASASAANCKSAADRGGAGSKSATIPRGRSDRRPGAGGYRAPPRYRGTRCAVVRGGGEERAIVGRGPRKGGRSGAGGRHRTKRAGGDDGANIAGRSKKNARAAPHWRANLRPRSARTRSRRRC